MVQWREGPTGMPVKSVQWTDLRAERRSASEGRSDACSLTLA